MSATDRDQLKRAAALRAIEEVDDGMIVGLGTGSTAAFVVEGLAARVAGGLRVVGIPTSERTAAQARRLRIPIATFAEHHYLIEKKRAGDRTRTSVRKITGTERTEEVARMISGAKVTETSLKHAEQMLKTNA